MTLIEQRDAQSLRATPSRALHYLPATALALDAALVVLALVLGELGRNSWDILNGTVADGMGWVMPTMAALWLGCIWQFGGYLRSAFGAGSDELTAVLRASLATAGLTSVLAFLAKLPLSRGFFFIAFALGIPLLLAGRMLMRRVLQRARLRGSLSHSVLLVGSTEAVDDVAQILSRDPGLGYRIVGALCPDVTEPETERGLPILGGVDEVVRHIDSSGADIVFFAHGGLSSPDEMRHIAWELEHSEVQVVVAPSVSDVSAERVHVRPVAGLPLIHIDPPRASEASRWGKRLFDMVGALAGLVLLAPFLLVVAAVIRVADPGPVFFRQTRTGRNGEEFRLFKFRTMVTDAEERLRDLQRQHGFTEGLFKLKDDPRITRPGKLLRRLSIDELPQLVNVLRGEMSLIGPRPPLPAEVATYDVKTARRLRVRPGLTGLWQVSGRSDLSWEEAVRLDLYYVDNWSPMQDLSILVKTVRAVLRSDGAY